MDLYEYQGKQLFARQGIPVPSGEVATTPAEARAAAEKIGGRVAVKAQVQVGGRGKAGGIKVAENPAEAEAHAEKILGMDIKGHTVHRVWVDHLCAACGCSRGQRLVKPSNPKFNELKVCCTASGDRPRTWSIRTWRSNDRYG